MELIQSDRRFCCAACRDLKCPGRNLGIILNINRYWNLSYSHLFSPDEFEPPLFVLTTAYPLHRRLSSLLLSWLLESKFLRGPLVKLMWLTMALDDVGSLFWRAVGGCRSQSEKDEENACYPQVHLVKLNLQRQNPVMRRSFAVIFIPLKDRPRVRLWIHKCVRSFKF